MAIEDVALTLMADLDDTGVFETDWSAFLDRFRVSVGRGAAIDRFGPRRGSFILDNTDSRFSPRNTSGPYTPDLKRGKRVQLAAVVTTPAVTNLFRNPSAETNLTDWSGFSTATIDRIQAAARFGKFGVEVSRTVSTYGVTLKTTIAPAAVTHTASAYVQGIGASVGEVITISLSATGGAGGAESATSAALTLTAGWQRIEVTLAVTAGDHTDLETTLVRTGAAAGESFHADAQQAAVESAPSSIYCDGDQPKGVWSGTEHASTSSRVANPSFNVFTGELAEFNVGRGSGVVIPEAEFVASGLTEQVFRTVISCGPFTRKGADLILQRVLDVIEGPLADSIGLDGEVFEDGGNRYGGDAIVAEAGTTVDKTYDNNSGDDPETWNAMEGDNVVRVTVFTGVGQGWKLDVTAATKFDSRYRFGVFVRAGNAGTSGQEVQLKIKQGGFTQLSAVITLSDTVWKYLSFIPTFETADATREVFVVTVGSGWGSGDEFWTDSHHMTEPHQAVSPTKSLLPLILLGTKWTGDLEYIDAFEKSAGSVLEEIAKSVGGWMYENGDGDLVFEDYTRRDNAVVTIPELRLSDEAADGLAYDLESYSEPAGSLAGVVRVGSLGDVTVQPAPAGATYKNAWQLEPHSPPQFAANEIRSFKATYTVEGESGPVIARRATMVVFPASGWVSENGVQTPWIKNYGRSGDITIKAPGSVKTMVHLIVGARIASREQNERSFIEFGGDVTPVMALDMPAQGFKTVDMNNLLIWALNKYNASPATASVVIEGVDLARLLEIFGRDLGLPVWLRHVTGPGNLAVDELFYTEAIKIELTAGRHPRLTLGLEEAT